MRQNKNTFLFWQIRTGSDWWFSKILRIRTGSDSILSEQDWTRTEKFHSPLFSGLGLEGFRPWSRSWRFQVSRLWILQRNGLLKFLWFNDFFLLHLHVKNNQNTSEKCQKFEHFSSQKWWRHFFLFRQNAQIWSFESQSRTSSLESRSFWWSLGVVSEF